MKIQISQDDRGNTSLKVDGVELSNYVTEFSLSQRGGEVPVLNLKLVPLDGIEVELPDGVVIAQSKDSPHAASRGAGTSEMD